MAYQPDRQSSGAAWLDVVEVAHLAFIYRRNRGFTAAHRRNKTGLKISGTNFYSSCRFSSSTFIKVLHAPQDVGTPERHRNPRGPTVATRAPHTTALGVTGERGLAAQVGERRA